jgi:hypothetical protein
MAQNNANQKLNDLLISKNFDPQSLNNQGKPAASPEEADLFSFDYKGESGQDYGTVVIMLNDENDLNVYFGDNIGKSMEGDDKKGWFDFLYQLRMFAKRNLFSFTLQNLNKLKYSMQGQAAISEGLFESWQGKKDISWNADSTQARLLIKHKRNIGEGEARFRNIQSLFIETADGERFKLPFTKLSAGRAMLEHVRQGGKPYDIRGNHIVTIVEEMNLLSRFRRANQGKIFEGETQQLVEQATHYFETLQSNLKSLSTKVGYTKYFESWNPAALTDEDVIIEDLRHMFVEQNIDSRIEQALPLLARLQQEQNMKEANIFENWTNLILEGTWAVPDTKEKQTALVTLLSQELPVGADATNATELLYDLLGDDELFDRLEELAEQDANADAREIILSRLEELKNNPDIAQVIGQLKTPTPDNQEPVQENFNTYDMDNTSCPSCHEKELTYSQGSNHVKCGACGKGFNLAGKPIDESLEDDASPVESAIINRIMRAHPDLLAKFGPEAIMTAARDQAEWIGDVDEIGSSDVSSYVNNVIRDLESTNHGTEELDELSPDTLKSYVKHASSDRAMRNFDQGVDMGVSYGAREPKFDKENDHKDNQRRRGIHKALGKLEEGAMKDWLWNEAERLDKDAFIDNAGEYGMTPEEAAEWWDSINGIDEGWKGQLAGGTVGTLAGTAAGSTLGPVGAIVGGALGGTAGQMIGDKLGGSEEETDEGIRGALAGGALGGYATKSIKGTVAGAKLGSALQDRLAKKDKDIAETANDTVDQMKQVQDEIEKIVRSGGRVGVNDPLSQKLKMLKAKLHKSKGVNENTALTGPYGHSGKLAPVEGTDEDMMARIKFLAGIRENDTATDGQENSNLTAMKSVSSIFIR